MAEIPATINPEQITHYTQPHQFEPLLPQNRLDELRQRTRAVIVRSLQITSSAHPVPGAECQEGLPDRLLLGAEVSGGPRECLASAR